MATVYVIDSTDGAAAKSLTIKPGALNGPGSAHHDSDMRLYGMGALQWGEGMDENVYRLAETFNCPEKELGDFNPASGLTDYDPATNPILPKDANDLGPGNGITVPLDGQLWYNATRHILFVYDASIPVWKVTSGIFVDTSQPINPEVGDLWYDTSTTGDPNGCIAEPVLKIYNPAHTGAGPDGFVLIGEDFVRQCGDWMSGILDMGGSDGGVTARHRITNLGDAVDPHDAVHKQAFDALGSDLGVHEADNVLHLTSLQNAYLDALNLPTLTAAESNFSTGLTSNVQAQLNGKISRAGDTMDNTTTLTLGRHPVAIFEASTKGYVDTAVIAADFMQHDPIGNGQPAQTGDTQAMGATIQMYLAGTGWVQIWPAQYHT